MALKWMRSQLGSLKWILWVILFTFVAGIFVYWGRGGISGRGGGVGANWAARVGSDEVTIRDFSNAYESQVSYYRRMFGQNFDPKILETFDIAGSVLDGLVRQRVALREARRLGLRVTPAELLAEVMKQPLFVKDGQFVGLAEYRKLLDERGIVLQDFERDLADGILLRKYEDLIRSSIYVSDEEVKNEFDETNNRVSISYVLFDPAAYAGGVSVTPEEARSWYESHRDSYKSEEERKVRYLFLLQNNEAKAIALRNEAKVLAEYEKGKDTLYTVDPDSRRASHVLFVLKQDAMPEEDAAQKARATEIYERAKAGEPFADLAARYSEDVTTNRAGGDLGFFKKGEMVPEFENAVFSLQPGEVRGPIKTAFGYHVILLTAAEGAQVRPLDDVRDEIAARLFADEAREAVAKKAAEVQEDLDAGKGVEEIAKDREIPMVDAGWVERKRGIPPLGSFDEIGKTIFELAPNAVSKPVDVSGGDKVFLQVMEIRAPEPLPYEKVQERVLADLELARRKEAARKDAEAVHAGLLARKPIEQALKDAGVKTPAEKPAPDAATPPPSPPVVRTAGPFTRRGAVPGIGESPELKKEALALEAGGIGKVLEVPGGLLAWKVDSRERPNPATLDTEKDGIRKRLVDQQFSGRYQETLKALMEGPYKKKILYNDALLQRVKPVKT